MAARAYLRPDERRRQLLDAASRLFDRGGFTAITVSAVATEAGASRRLVYDHFADLGDLYAAFFEDRVARWAAAIDAASAPGAGGARSLTGAVHQLLSVPPEDLRAVHLLLADAATPELAGARDALRAHLQSRWLPALGALGVEPDEAVVALGELCDRHGSLCSSARGGRRALSPHGRQPVSLP